MLRAPHFWRRGDLTPHSLPFGLTFALALLALTPARAQTATLDTLVVTATRTPQAATEVAATLKLLPGNTLREAPVATLDGALRSIPGFSLFRRSDSFTANPTAQGVSLRGLGPSGASRSLVLLDGVPLNDPFGGWVAWTKIPREGLGHAEIVPGGGATAWGNAALGGVVQLFTDLHPQPAAATTLQFNATLGDYGTRSAELALTVPTRAGVVQVLGRDFITDGFALVAPERRGPLDTAAGSRHRWLTVRWQRALGDTMQLLATARMFEEQRGNGTPYQRNGSREKFASLALAGQPDDAFAWNGVAYVQDQSFASTFSSVNATRTAETPASDQFAVPSTAAGAAWTGILKHRDASRTSVGADARHVRGETREHFTFTAGNFTRRRVAGGAQAVAGLFVLHERLLADSLRLTLGARLDRWNETDGHRRESDRVTGIASRDDHYADRAGSGFSPSAGLRWTPAAAWRFRANAQRAFRRPTLNELYRPFRVGANLTEANAALGTEQVVSAEAGAEWTPFGMKTVGNTPASAAKLVVGLTAFTNDLHDAVGNVTLARGPGTFPIVGTLAAGAVGRQRLNLDRTRARGFEFSTRWTPVPALTLNGELLWNDASVRRAAVAPALVGNRVAQVPRRSAALGAVWRAPAQFTVTPRLRALSRQFEDDENQLTLGAVAIIDLGISRPLTKHVELFCSAENLGNARVETGRSVDGIVNTGTPRLVLGGLRGRW